MVDYFVLFEVKYDRIYIYGLQKGWRVSDVFNKISFTQIIFDKVQAKLVSIKHWIIIKCVIFAGLVTELVTYAPACSGKKIKVAVPHCRNSMF